VAARIVEVDNSNRPDSEDNIYGSPFANSPYIQARHSEQDHYSAEDDPSPGPSSIQFSSNMEYNLSVPSTNTKPSHVSAAGYQWHVFVDVWDDFSNWHFPALPLHDRKVGRVLLQEEYEIAVGQGISWSIYRGDVRRYNTSTNPNEEEDQHHHEGPFCFLIPHSLDDARQSLGTIQQSVMQHFFTVFKRVAVFALRETASVDSTLSNAYADFIEKVFHPMSTNNFQIVLPQPVHLTRHGYSSNHKGVDRTLYNCWMIDESLGHFYISNPQTLQCLAAATSTSIDTPIDGFRTSCFANTIDLSILGHEIEENTRFTRSCPRNAQQSNAFMWSTISDCLAHFLLAASGNHLVGFLEPLTSTH
jgi:hypothetical protein